jgi:hypothetical protein
MSFLVNKHIILLQSLQVICVIHTVRKCAQIKHRIGVDRCRQVKFSFNANLMKQEVVFIMEGMVDFVIKSDARALCAKLHWREPSRAP